MTRFLSALPPLLLLAASLSALERPRGLQPIFPASGAERSAPAAPRDQALPPRPDWREAASRSALGAPGPGSPRATCGAAGVPVQSPLTAGVTVTGDTTGKTAALNGYTRGGVAIAPDESGPELVYSFTTTTTGDIRAFVDPNPRVDVDVLILAACDTAAALAYGDYAAVALNQPPGTYYIVVDTYNYGTSVSPVYYPGPFKLTATVSAGLLLVDDDGSGDPTQCTSGCPDVRPSYTAALTAAAIPYTVHDVATLGSPAIQTLAAYKSVIWFTGGAFNAGKTLTPADQANLQLFLQLGGRALVTGQDILFDLMAGNDGRLPDGTLLHDYFQVTSVTQDVDNLPPNTLCPIRAGVPGTLTISGNVKDLAGANLVNQIVCYSGPITGRVTTDALGNYSFPNLPAGTYAVTVLNRSQTSPAAASVVLTTVNSAGNNFTVQANPWPPGRTLAGVQGNPVSSDVAGAAQAFSLGTTPYNPYTDGLYSRYGDPVFYTADNKVAGLMYNGNGFFNAPQPYFKALFFAFSPELDTTAGRLQTLLTRAVNWLAADNDGCRGYDATYNPNGIALGEALVSEVGGTVNGYPDPGETVTYRLTLTNHDTVAHYLKVGLAAKQTYANPNPAWQASAAAVAAGGSTTMDFTVAVGTPMRVGETLLREYNLVIASATNAGAAYCRGFGYGSFAGQAQALVVKDEGIRPNTTGVDLYTDAFKALGRTWAVWDTAVFGHPPYGPTAGYLANEKMDVYSSVFWFTGYDYAGTLLPAFTGDRNPETDLATLLNAQSGRLFLSSQDYLWEKYKGLTQDIPTTDFAYTQLMVSRVNQDLVKDATSNVAGENGAWATAGTYNTLGQPIFGNFADGTNLRAGVPTAQLLARWAATGFPTGTVRMCNPGVDCAAGAVNGLKMVFMPYAFENLADGGGASNKQRLLERILCQFQAANSTPPCGYSRPAPLGNLPTVYPLKPAPSSWLLRWSDVPLACNGEAIGGNWRLAGATAPAALNFLRTAPAAPVGSDATVALTETPAAGQTWFYSVNSFTDAFGTAPSTCP